MSQDLRAVSPDLYVEQRYREGEFICDICGDPWPRSHRRRHRGGQYVGALCCFESDGDETARDLRRAWASKMAARLSKKELLHDLRGDDGVVYSGVNPLAGSPTIDYGGFITQIRWGASSAEPPVVLPRLVVVAVTLTGIGFEATDTIVYGSALITNASAPIFDSATQITLSVIADIPTPTGSHKLTFNGSIWQAVFSVR